MYRIFAYILLSLHCCSCLFFSFSAQPDLQVNNEFYTDNISSLYELIERSFLAQKDNIPDKDEQSYPSLEDSRITFVLQNNLQFTCNGITPDSLNFINRDVTSKSFFVVDIASPPPEL